MSFVKRCPLFNRLYSYVGKKKPKTDECGFPSIQVLNLDTELGTDGSYKRDVQHKRPDEFDGTHSKANTSKLLVKHNQRRVPPERFSHTWPSVQYKLWLDLSNLSLHRLIGDERIPQPPSDRQTENLKRSHYDDNKKLHSRVIAAGVLNEPPDLCIGSDKWKVDASLTGGSSLQRNISLKQGDVFQRQISSTRGHRILSGSRRSTENRNATSGVAEFPRLPSRMGRNSLQKYYLNGTCGEVNTTTVHPKIVSARRMERNNVSTKMTSTCEPLPQDSHLKLLRLKGFVRDPVGFRSNPRRKEVESLNEEGRLELEERQVNKKRKLVFQVPHTSVEARSVTGDVPSSSSSLHFDDTYYITKYLCHR